MLSPGDMVVMVHPVYGLEQEVGTVVSVDVARTTDSPLLGPRAWVLWSSEVTPLDMRFVMQLARV